jgi:hypothetical protein
MTDLKKTPWSVHVPNRGRIEQLLEEWRTHVGSRGKHTPIHVLFETALESAIYHAKKGNQ